MTKLNKPTTNKFKLAIKANSYSLMQLAIKLTKQGVFIF